MWSQVTEALAKVFGPPEIHLQRSSKIADREARRSRPPGDRGGGDSEAKLRELRRRNKLLEQENEVLRRAIPQRPG